MRKFRITISIGLIGCKRTLEIEVEDDATEDEIEEAAREAAFNFIEWDYREAE